MRYLLPVLLSIALPAQADYHDHPRAPLLLENLKVNYGYSPEELAAVNDALAQAECIPKLVEA